MCSLATAQGRDASKKSATSTLPRTPPLRPLPPVVPPQAEVLSLEERQKKLEGDRQRVAAEQARREAEHKLKQEEVDAASEKPSRKRSVFEPGGAPGDVYMSCRRAPAGL